MVVNENENEETSEPIKIDSLFWENIKGQIIWNNQDNKLVETWLKPVLFVEVQNLLDGPKIVLGVPTSLHQYFIIENLTEKIYFELSQSLKGFFEVDFIVNSTANLIPNIYSGAPLISQIPLSPSIQSQGQNYSSPPSPVTPSPNSPPTQLSSPPSSFLNERVHDVLNPEYVFSTFVVGKNTEFAHAASFNVAQNPGAFGYNPLFVCGPVGMGKTHLVHATGNQIRLSYPQMRISYISAERFLNECISAIRRHDMDKFRQKYRENCDIFLVDDVQFIGRGEAVQEEFFHTINTFIEKKKQCVIASDRMPKDIVGLEDRLRSRLEWGLIADISMPDIETRVAILRYKAERMGLRLGEDVVHYIARISKRSIRELEGNLKTVEMFSKLQGLSIDITLARKVLSGRETHTSISLEEIQRLVSEHYNIRLNDLKSTTRAKQVVIPRQVAMFLIKKFIDKSLVDIGRAFGGKDHTTVMNAINRVTYLQSRDLDLKNDIDELTNRIHNITGL